MGLLILPVSIHAPTKGATRRMCQGLMRLCFNPRSHEGSDSIRAISSLTCFSFQSTLPRRERLGVARYNHSYSQGFNPRSHEGSDGEYRGEIINQYRFNPRSREGSDNSDVAKKLGISRFQSTLPRRERLERSRYCTHKHGFNPRSREGSDSCKV